MLITVEGYRRHNMKLFNSLECAADFYARTLLGKRMAKYILLEIKLTKNLKKKEHPYGSCHITDDNLNRPREFMIELDASMRHSLDQLLIWLAHEMVHLKQFVRNELCDYETKKVRWKSRVYSEDLEYADHPWEKEAYRLEEPLYKEFKESYE